MKTLILLCAPSGAGKSTLAHELINKSNDQIWVNQDFHGKEGHLELFSESLRLGKDIVIDRMNFNKQQRERYLKPAKEAGYHTKIIVLHAPKAVCLERCIKRIGNHPTIATEKDAHSALNMFFSKYERPVPEEANEIEFRNDIGIEKTPAIWIDIDNTLSNNDHREHFLSGTKKDWKGFFSQLHLDPVNEPIKAIANNFYENGKVQVLICTARPDDYKKSTEEWLKNNDVKYHRMIMRQRGDYRKDSIVKEQMLDFEINPLHNLLFSVDDRKDVIDKIRSRDVTVLDCAGERGNF